MPTLVIPNTLQVACSGTNLGTNWTNVYGLQVDSAFLMSDAVATEITNAFGAMYAALAAFFNLGWVWDEVYINDLRTLNAPSYVPSFNGVSGTNTEHALSPAIAACVSHGTGFGGRSYRGRTYLSGWTESQNDGDGTIAAAVRQNVVTLFNNLRTDLENNVTNGAQLAVVSRTLLVSTAVTAHSVDAEWDHQDRRKRG